MSDAIFYWAWGLVILLYIFNVLFIFFVLKESRDSSGNRGDDREDDKGPEGGSDKPVVDTPVPPTYTEIPVTIDTGWKFKPRDRGGHTVEVPA